jgi:hypothetical protein
MKVYDLKGMFLSASKAVVAVSLPKESDDNKYSIKVIGKFDDNGVKKLKIHLRDIECEDLTIPNNTNFVSFIVDLSLFGFTESELINPISVVFHHIKGKHDLIGTIIKTGTGTIQS